MPRWPSRLGRQTHREITESVLWSPEKSGGHGFGSRPGHFFYFWAVWLLVVFLKLLHTLQGCVNESFMCKYD